MSMPAFAAGPPAVSGLNPTTGSTAGGNSVIITGSELSDATGVLFGTVPALFQSNSATQITAIAPMSVAGIVNVTVTTPLGSSPAAPANQYTYVAPAPTITGVNPPSGVPAGGTNVILSGTSFTGATAVRFGTTSASFLVNSDAQITTVSPLAGGPGAVNVTVTTGSGTSVATAANVYTYQLPAPTVSVLSPASGPVAGGTTVFISGTGFTGATAVRFGAANAIGYVVNSDTQITASAPAAAPGAVAVTVTGPTGTSAASATSQYTYLGAGLAVTGVSPSSGPPSGGTVVVITGSGFTGATAVIFGGIGVAYTVNSDTQITVIAPAGSAPGTVNVTVTTGAGTSAVNTNARYTYQTAGPVVSGLNPPFGPVGGGTVVVITGSGFSGTTSVTFGGLGASYTVNSDAQITAVTPPHSAGAVDVFVASTAGISPNSGANNFSYTGVAGPPICPTPVLWTNDLAYGSPGGGFYWDSVSGLVWTAQRSWHLFAPQPLRPFPQPLWVNALSYGSAGGGFYWDPVSGEVWTAERGWHLYAPQGCVIS